MSMAWQMPTIRNTGHNTHAQQETPEASECLTRLPMSSVLWSCNPIQQHTVHRMCCMHDIRRERAQRQELATAHHLHSIPYYTCRQHKTLYQIDCTRFTSTTSHNGTSSTLGRVGRYVNLGSEIGMHAHYCFGQR